MKRTLYVWLAGILLAGITVPVSGAQDTSAQEPSLGSYARNARKDKKPAAAKKFDNDNLPRQDKLSVVGPESQTAAAAESASLLRTTGSPAPDSPADPAKSTEERQKANDQWQQRITVQQSQVDLLARELDVVQREYRLRAAAVYGDAGDRLRNQAAWDKEDADYKGKVADKQKALDEAKEQLTSMQEEARKSGVPSSAREPGEPHE